ncbi:MAG: twin-arginine translocase subunit TatB [Pseudorhodoplanes sp.]|nr:twin-arginine translocase subunit TatB [Pseudorhodoplanes sp.]
MFDIGWSELLVIGVVALIAIGPKELPGVLRMVGQWAGKVRRMASEFQGQFQDAMREAEMADLKRQFDEAASTATDFGNSIASPLETVRKDVEKALDTTETASPTQAPPVDTAIPPPVEPAPVSIPVNETPALATAGPAKAEAGSDTKRGGEAS